MVDKKMVLNQEINQLNDQWKQLTLYEKAIEYQQDRIWVEKNIIDDKLAEIFLELERI
jgi:hypothetical protein